MPNAIGDVLDRIEADQAMELGSEALSLDLLRAIYRNASIPLHTRMRAAGMAIAYEFPRLQATAFVSGQDFATLLDERVKRHRERLVEERTNRVIEANDQPKVIEAKPEPVKTIEGPIRRRV